MPSPNDWAANKHLLYALYITQGMTVAEVREYMSRIGFHASKSQFSNWLNHKWKFLKSQHKVAAKTWRHIDYKVKKRKREGKDSDVFIDGILVEPKKVKKEAARNFYSIQETLELERSGAQSPFEPRINVKTPLSTTVGTPLPITVEEPPSIDEVYANNVTPIGQDHATRWPVVLPWLRFCQFFERTNVSWLIEPVNVEAQAFSSSALTGVETNDLVTQASRGTIKISDIAAKLPTLKRAAANMDVSIPGGLNNNHLLTRTTALLTGAVSVNETTDVLIKVMLYLISNNLVGEWGEDIRLFLHNYDVLQVLHDAHNQILQQPTFVAFLDKLLEDAVHNHDLATISQLLKHGRHPEMLIECRNPRADEGHHLALVVLIEDESLDDGSKKQLVQAFLSKGASPMTYCCMGHRTALHCAMINGQPETLDAVLASLNVDHSANFDVQEDQGSSATENSLDTSSTSSTSRVTSIPTSMTFASMKSATTNLFNCSDAKNRINLLATADILIRATRKRNFVLLRVLHENGVSMNRHNDSGEFPLGEASKISPKACKILLRLGASSNYKPRGAENRAWPALHLALTSTQTPRNILATCKILLNNGADVEKAATPSDMTPMDYALTHSLYECAELFFQYGVSKSSLQLLQIFELPRKTQVQAQTRFLKKFIAQSQGLDLEIQNKEGKTSLHLAAEAGLFEAGRVLVEAGIAITPGMVRLAINGCHWNLAKFLLDKVFARNMSSIPQKCLCYRLSIDINRKNGYCLDWSIQDYLAKSKQNPQIEAGFLCDAFKTGDNYIIPLVLQSFPMAYSSQTLCQAIESLEHGVSWHNVEEIIKRRTDKAKSAKEETTAIWLSVRHAVRNEDFRLIKSLGTVDQCWISPNEDDSELGGRPYWGSPLEGTIDEASPSTLRMLLAAGFKPNTYVGLAVCCKNRLDHLTLLLEFGWDPNQRYPWSRTALQYAVERANIPMIQLLLQSGAEINAPGAWQLEDCSHRRQQLLKDSSGDATSWNRDALQLAVEMGNLEATTLLIDSGADVNQNPACLGGATALQLACIRGFIRLAMILISKGAKINADGARLDGRTALEGAAEHGRLDTVQLLLHEDCSIHGHDRGQFVRAVHFASRRGHSVIVAELKKFGGWNGDTDGALLKGIQKQHEVHGDEGSAGMPNRLDTSQFDYSNNIPTEAKGKIHAWRDDDESGWFAEVRNSN